MRRLFTVVLLGCLSVGSLTAAPLRQEDVAADAKWLLHMNVEQMVGSQLGGMLLDESKLDEHAKMGLSFVRSVFGMDLLKDVKGVTLYGRTYEHGGAVALVRGTFDAAKLVEMMKASEAYETAAFGNLTLHKWVKGKHQKRPGWVCFKGDCAVLGQSADDVRAALGVLEGGQPGLKGTTSMQIPADVAGAFVVASAAKDASGGIGQRARAAVLQNAEWLNFTLGESAGQFVLVADVGMKDVASAEQTDQVLRGMIAYMTLSRTTNPTMAALVDGLKVTNVNGRMSIRFHCTVQQMYDFLQAQKELRKNMHPRHGGQPECTNAVPGAH